MLRSEFAAIRLPDGGHLLLEGSLCTPLFDEGFRPQDLRGLPRAPAGAGHLS